MIMKHNYNSATKHGTMLRKTNVVKMFRGIIAFMLPLLIFSGCMDDDFDENDLWDVCPRVEIDRLTPVSDAEGVPVKTEIHVVFNKVMNPKSFKSDSTFIVKDANDNTIWGVRSFDGETVIFKPNKLLPDNTEITVKIKKEVYDFYDFNLEGDVSWKFRTGTEAEISAPFVIFKSPKDGAENVVLNTRVIAEFNEPLDPATIGPNSFRLLKDGAALPGTVTYDNRIAQFIPGDYLEPFTMYEAVLSAGIADPMGNEIENDIVWSFTTGDVIEHIPNSVDISEIDNFAILSGRYIMNISGTSSITGDVGLYPGVYTDITGIDTLNHVDGTVYVTGAVPIDGLPRYLIRAKRELAKAYDYAKDANDPVPISLSGDQGGVTLTPGIYKAQTLSIKNGDLILDAQGDPHTFWIFQVETLLETGGAGGNIILEGGAQARNIFWQVGIREILGPNVLLGDNTSFAGNILSKQGISMGANGHITGRLLVMDGGVRLQNSTVVIP